MIRLEHVSREFQVGDSRVRALDDVTEHVRTGEHIAIMGPSGSGKSTLLNVIGCLDRPSAGTYHLDGRLVSELDDGELTLVRRNLIGFVFQTFQLVPRLSALENVELPMLFAGVEREERRARAAERLAAVGLTPRADHRPDQMSGGERQRVAIARAMVMEPRVLLADEPTGNLDTRSGAQVLELIDDLHTGGLTIVVVTHDPNVAKRAERTIVLVDGSIARRLAASEITPSVVGGAT
ncbi:MAG: ABC transporter ATP-binding protein [Myxococcales bacterium]|nr:ABC transporter ATP-binding protein [Myxococcales bacterium]